MQTDFAIKNTDLQEIEPSFRIRMINMQMSIVGSTGESRSIKRSAVIHCKLDASM